MTQKKLIIILISLIVLLGTALTIYLITREEEEIFIPKETVVKENTVIEEETGLITEDLHVGEVNNKTYALDEDKKEYSVGELVFGEPVGRKGVAYSDKGGTILGVKEKMVLAGSYPNYLYYYDLKEKKAKWITTVGTKAFASQNSDYTLYFEFVDITNGVNSVQRVMTFNNETSARQQIGTLPDQYKPLQGTITSKSAYYTISNDYGVTKKAMVIDIASGKVSSNQQQQLETLKIDYLKDDNGKVYFSSNETKKIYTLNENEELVEVGNFVGEKLKDVTMYGENILVSVENNYVVSVYLNGQIKESLASYSNGHWVDERNMIIEMYDGVYVYDTKEDKLDALKKGVSDFYLIGNMIYYFDGTSNLFYSMEIENR